MNSLQTQRAKRAFVKLQRNIYPWWCSTKERPIIRSLSLSQFLSWFESSEPRIKVTDSKTLSPLEKILKRRQHEFSRRKGTGTLQSVVDRTGLICGLCTKPVELQHLSFDHIVPLSRGGEDDASNLQVAHLRCNLEKGRSLAWTKNRGSWSERFLPPQQALRRGKKED